MSIEPFSVYVPETELEDLRRRIQSTRWPDRETVPGWVQGAPLQAVRDLVDYWATEYDWRRFEKEIAALPQFRTHIDGIDLHFLHVRSSHADAKPLLLTHGWPGSFVEFLDVIRPLTEPDTEGPAFHLVIPSLPGFAFSSRPTEAGWGIDRMARAFDELMKRLGYDRYCASGGDWGTSISTMLGVLCPDSLIGIHLTPPWVAPDAATIDNLTEWEQESLQILEGAHLAAGYAYIQSTRPQTIGYALADSAVGQAAWIFEKFVAWTDLPSPDAVFEVMSRDRLLDNITLYWLTNTAASSARLYWEDYATINDWFHRGMDHVVHVPTGASVYRDMPRPSRRWVERLFPNLQYWNEPERGGHFAAFEQPKLFVDDLRASFTVLCAD